MIDDGDWFTRRQELTKCTSLQGGTRSMRIPCALESSLSPLTVLFKTARGVWLRCERTGASVSSSRSHDTTSERRSKPTTAASRGKNQLAYIAYCPFFASSPLRPLPLLAMRCTRPLFLPLSSVEFEHKLAQSCTDTNSAKASARSHSSLAVLCVSCRSATCSVIDSLRPPLTPASAPISIDRWPSLQSSLNSSSRLRALHTVGEASSHAPS